MRRCMPRSTRRQLHRHRRRVRRRPQRAAGRAAAPRAAAASRSTSPPRPAAGCRSRRWRATRRENLDRLGRAQPAEPRRRRRSICCSSTARTPTSTTGPEVFGILDDLVRGGEGAALRRQRGDGRRGDARDAAPERPDRADHLQHVPPEAGRAVLCRRPRRGRSASSRACRSRAACSPASSGATSTFAADDHRTFNREGQAFDKGETFSGVPYEAASRRSRSCARWCRRARPWRSSRCAGS